MNATAKIRTRPLLAPFLEFQSTNFRSAILVEGENLTLNCSFQPGYEKDGNIHWYSFGEVDDFVIDDSESSRIAHEINTSDPRITIVNDEFSSILTIKNVNPKDRMFYACNAVNPVGSYNNTILLRVKGQ